MQRAIYVKLLQKIDLTNLTWNVALRYCPEEIAMISSTFLKHITFKYDIVDVSA